MATKRLFILAYSAAFVPFSGLKFGQLLTFSVNALSTIKRLGVAVNGANPGRIQSHPTLFETTSTSPWYFTICLGRAIFAQHYETRRANSSKNISERSSRRSGSGPPRGERN